MTSKKLKSIYFWLIAFLAFGVAGYAIFAYLVLTPGDLVSPGQKIVYTTYRLEIILHALFASIALAIGVPQLNKNFRDKHPKTNIIFRNIYFFSVIVGAITGLFLAFHAQGGLANIFGFALLAVIWLYSCFMAIWSLQKNDFGNFRIWIVRSYALTFAAVTLRIYLGIFMATMGYLRFGEFYPVLGFLCWVPNLILVEWFLLQKTTPKVMIDNESKKV